MLPLVLLLVTFQGLPNHINTLYYRIELFLHIFQNNPQFIRSHFSPFFSPLKVTSPFVRSQQKSPVVTLSFLSFWSLGFYHWEDDLISINSRSEEHTSELQSRLHLVCRLLLEKK